MIIPLRMPCTVFAALAAASVSQAQLASTPPADEDFKARPTLMSEQSALVPGQTSWIGIRFEIVDGWHTYWPGVNDSGFPASFDITVSATGSASEPVDAEIGSVLWPAPRRYIAEGGLLDHVYEHHVTMMMPITLPGDLRASEVTITAKGDWLVCEVECIPEFTTIALTLPVASDTSGVGRSASAPHFQQARKRHAQPWPSDGSLSQSVTDDRVTWLAPGASKVAFYPAQGSRVPLDLLKDGLSTSDTLTLTFRPQDKPVQGILEVWPATDEPSRVYRVHVEP